MRVTENPATGGSSLPVGSVIELPVGSAPPENYLLTDRARVLLKSAYPDLATALGSIPNNWSPDSVASPNVSVGGDLIVNLLVLGDTILAQDQDGRVSRSTDGGDTWTQTLAGTSSNYDKHQLIEHDGRIIAAGRYTNGGMRYSTDDGQTWSTPTVPDTTDFADDGIVALGGGVWIVKTEDQETWRSTDDGVTFTLSGTNSNNNYFGLTHLNGVLWSFSSNSSRLISIDGGAINDGPGTFAISKTGTVYSCAVGNRLLIQGQDTVAYSDDGGRTWVEPLTVSSGTAGGIYALGGSVVIAVFGFRSAYISLDAGATWAKVDDAGGTSWSRLAAARFGDELLLGRTSSVGRAPIITYNTTTQFYLPHIAHPSIGLQYAIKAS